MDRFLLEQLRAQAEPVLTGAGGSELGLASQLYHKYDEIIRL
jgi:hypothetical protein